MSTVKASAAVQHGNGQKKLVVFNKDIIKEKLTFLTKVVSAVNGVSGDERDRKVKQVVVDALLDKMVDNLYDTLDLGQFSRSYTPSQHDVGLEKYLVNEPVEDLVKKVHDIKEWPSFEKKAADVISSSGFDHYHSDPFYNNPIELDIKSSTAGPAGARTNEASLSDGKEVIAHPTMDVLAPALAERLLAAEPQAENAASSIPPEQLKEKIEEHLSLSPDRYLKEDSAPMPDEEESENPKQAVKRNVRKIKKDLKNRKRKYTRKVATGEVIRKPARSRKNARV